MNEELEEFRSNPNQYVYNWAHKGKENAESVTTFMNRRNLPKSELDAVVNAFGELVGVGEMFVHYPNGMGGIMTFYRNWGI